MAHHSKFTRALGIKIVLCILGNIIIGIGAAFTKMALFGNDPFNGMALSVSAFLHIPYVAYVYALNLILFVFEWIWGRKYINIGSFINMFLMSVVVDFFIPVFEGLVGYPDSMIFRVLILLGGMIITSFGLALYQEANLGVAPYDAVPLMVVDHFPKVKFFWARIALDSLSALLILLTGGILGIGTLANALCLGPFVHIFTLMIRGKAKEATAG